MTDQGIHELLAWYQQHKRDLPWRRSANPYHIWVSEVMLQQTRVETVIPYYRNFLAKFPTIQTLADAGDDEVYKAWEGLGYYRRVKNLQAGARQVMERHDGRLPRSLSDLRKIQGIGEYTAGAICAIAFHEATPAIDGNVLRVLSRWENSMLDITQTAARRHFRHVAQKLIPPRSAGDFTQSLMELGALVCTPRKPACLLCPVGAWCKAHQQGNAEHLPVKSTRPPVQTVRMAVGLLVYKNRILIARRPDKALLGGTWTIPTWPADHDDIRQAIIHGFHEHFNIRIIPDRHVGDFHHTFTHRKWKMGVYRCVLASRERAPRANKHRKWIRLRRDSDVAIATAHGKILDKLSRTSERVMT